MKTYVRVKAKFHAVTTSALCADQLQTQVALIEKKDCQYQLHMKLGRPHILGSIDTMAKRNIPAPLREPNPARPTRSQLGNDPTMCNDAFRLARSYSCKAAKDNKYTLNEMKGVLLRNLIITALYSAWTPSRVKSGQQSAEVPVSEKLRKPYLNIS